MGFIEKTAAIRMAVVGCDYITSLGLAQILAHASYLDIVGSAPDCRGAVELMGSEPLDLILVAAATGREELIRICTKFVSFPNPPRVVVMGDVDNLFAEDLLLAGASAILHHGRVAEDLPTLLRVVHGGGALLLNAGAHDALKDRNQQSHKGHRDRFESLNMRERAVAAGIADGLTNLQMSAVMHVSEATTKVLVSNVMNKLGVDNRVQVAVSVTKAQFV